MLNHTHKLLLLSPDGTDASGAVTDPNAELDPSLMNDQSETSTDMPLIPPGKKRFVVKAITQERNKKLHALPGLVALPAAPDHQRFLHGCLPWMWARPKPHWEMRSCESPMGVMGIMGTGNDTARPPQGRAPQTRRDDGRGRPSPMSNAQARIILAWWPCRRSTGAGSSRLGPRAGYDRSGPASCRRRTGGPRGSSGSSHRRK